MWSCYTVWSSDTPSGAARFQYTTQAKNNHYGFVYSGGSWISQTRGVPIPEFGAKTYYYRLQRSNVVMCVHGGDIPLPSACWDTHRPRQTPSPGQTPAGQTPPGLYLDKCEIDSVIIPNGKRVCGNPMCIAYQKFPPKKHEIENNWSNIFYVNPQLVCKLDVMLKFLVVWQLLLWF